MRWSPERMNQLERAVRDGNRIILSRRGSEFVVIAKKMTTVGRHEGVVGRLPATGEELVFLLHELDDFQIIT